MGAQVVVFPELSLTGYELELAPGLSFSGEDVRLDPLRDMSASHDVTVVAGAPLLLESVLYLAAFIIGPDGSVRHYMKRHLGAFGPEANPGGRVPPPEASVFAPGTLNPPVSWDAGTAAVAICADVGRPEHVQAAWTGGADTYLASMFVIPGDIEIEVTRLQDAAARYAMAVVFANFGGPSGGLPAAGRSAIFAPGGDCVVALGHSGAGVAVATEGEGGWTGMVERLEA